MTKPEFVYVTYIKTTPEKLWQAITNPEFTRQYWAHENRSDWKVGATWEHVGDGNVRVHGKVLEVEPPKRLSMSWAAPDDEADISRVTMDITPEGDMTRLEVIHENFIAGSEMLEGISKGWPRVLSSLKTFLETGEGMNSWLMANKTCNSAQ